MEERKSHLRFLGIRDKLEGKKDDFILEDYAMVMSLTKSIMGTKVQYKTTEEWEGIRYIFSSQ